MIERDLLKSQVQRGLDGYKQLCNLINKNKKYGAIIAHETFCSGLASLYLSNHLTPNFKILDITEYPIFSQRSSAKIRLAGSRNPYADALTYDFAINIANKFDYCISTSAGQADVYTKNNCTTSVDLVFNCRAKDDLCVNPTDILRSKYNFDQSDIILVFPNRVYTHAGLEKSIYALTQLDRRFKLVVLGEVVDDLTEKIKKLVTIYELEDRFFVTGMLDPSLVLPTLSEADIALIPLEPTLNNHKYCLPNRLFDALATNTPIVAFNGTEIGEFVQNHQIGTVCNYSRSQASLHRSIEDAVSHIFFYKDRMKKVSIDYTWEVQVEKVLKVLQENCTQSRRILLVAIKDIRRNDRIRRLASSLVKNNYQVDIVTNWRPFDSMIVNGVNYYCIKT